MKEIYEEYKDLGWMNGWSTFPEEYLKCRQLKHPVREIQHYDSGSHNEVICEICKLRWHYDSSG